ncbi:MAG: succinate dehydrogenase assembly factor 2 [Gammaproteobacteria bacterium]|nr:succinate dehydrogenase assembly factor 2 [Gammaproteobacteria bacterium]
MPAEKIRRLRWRCRRGMRELDVLLTGYMDSAYEAAPPEHQQAFEFLLTMQDPEIHALLTGRTVAQDPYLRDVVQRLLTHD